MCTTASGRSKIWSWYPITACASPLVSTRYPLSPPPPLSPSAGHLGVTKTVELVGERFCWYGLQHDVEGVVLVRCRQCEKCAKMKKSPQTTARAPLVSSYPGYPFERIALDTMEPIPTTESGKQVHPCRRRLRNEKRRLIFQTRRQKLVKSHFQVWSARKDPIRKGTKLLSPAVPGMCVLFNMGHTRTSQYPRESDGMVERMKRTLQDIFAKYVSNHQRDWDERLPLVMKAYCSSVQASTRYNIIRFIFFLAMRYDCQSMLCFEHNQTTRQKCQTM